mmetsp:Transcript_11317/g.28656  ORF Transcript_11317/g.28656 Transcript_11317/m.28656 type:complete len:254 (+) Transcript_11317:1239-2000(+)
MHARIDGWTAWLDTPDRAAWRNGERWMGCPVPGCCVNRTGRPDVRCRGNVATAAVVVVVVVVGGGFADALRHRCVCGWTCTCPHIRQEEEESTSTKEGGARHPTERGWHSPQRGVARNKVQMTKPSFHLHFHFNRMTTRTRRRRPQSFFSFLLPLLPAMHCDRSAGLCSRTTSIGVCVSFRVREGESRAESQRLCQGECVREAEVAKGLCDGLRHRDAGEVETHAVRLGACVAHGVDNVHVRIRVRNGERANA